MGYHGYNHSDIGQDPDLPQWQFLESEQYIECVFGPIGTKVANYWIMRGGSLDGMQMYGTVTEAEVAIGYTEKDYTWAECGIWTADAYTALIAYTE